jgi:hypothetical protein
MPILAFDMDGTVTPPKQPIDRSMSQALEQIMQTHEVWLVTGSTIDLAVSQLGSLLDLFSRVYTCAGNECWVGNQLVKQSPLVLPPQFSEAVSAHLNLVPGRVVHVSRTGLLSYRFEHPEARHSFAEAVNAQFPSVRATLAGRFSVDIVQHDAGKHTVLDDTTKPIWYWGDECSTGGNDASIAERLRIGAGNRVFATRNWQDTLHQLKETFDVHIRF